jgi:thiol-disulfide isomerase/thioredoxin
MNTKRNLLLAGLLWVGLVAFAIPYAVRHVRASARQGTPAARPAAHIDPIRFVKDPEMAPAIDLKDISGNADSVASWKGKVVLVVFWATWCPPCREEIPAFIELQKKYKDRLQIVGISEDEDAPEKVLQFAQHAGINYPVVMATPVMIAKYGGVPALPTTFVIDTQGHVVQKHMGLTSVDVYDREIRALLGLPGDAPVETFVDTGQVFLKNAANATEIPGVKLDGLTPAQKKSALHRLNAESCTCGCMLTLTECRVNDTTCPVSVDIAKQVVSDVVKGVAPNPAASPAAAAPTP